MATDHPEPERLWFDEHSWVDITRGFLPDAQDVYDALVEKVAWQQRKLWRYERWIDEPRMGAGFAARDIPHPDMIATQRAVEARYRVKFLSVGLNYYRDQRDSQAFHRDRDMRYLDDTVVAILSLGARRSFLVGPRGRRDKFLAENGGATHNLKPAGGDLMVFGGRFQADWEHAVPKMPYAVSGRISAQWRWTSRRGRPVEGPSYGAPRQFSRPRTR